MKSSGLLLLVAMFISMSFSAHAQDAVLSGGSPEILKGQTILNVAFVYDGMKVGGLSEEFYLKQKKSEFRKVADYEKFAQKWVADRAATYEPKFMQQLNFYLKRMNLVASINGESAKYTMTVQTQTLEPGFWGSSSAMKRPTFIDLLVTIGETANKENILCTITVPDITGITEEQNDMKQTDLRIASAYGLAAEKISKLIVKIDTKKEKVKDDPDEIKHIKKDKKNKDADDDEIKPDKKSKKDKSDVNDEDENTDKKAKKEKKNKKDNSDDQPDE